MIGDRSIGGSKTCVDVTTSGRVATFTCTTVASPLSAGMGRAATQYVPASVSGVGGANPPVWSSGEKLTPTGVVSATQTPPVGHIVRSYLRGNEYGPADATSSAMLT